MLKIVGSKSHKKKPLFVWHFRAACKKLDQSNLTISRIDFFAKFLYSPFEGYYLYRWGPLPHLKKFCNAGTRPPSTLKVTWLNFVFGIFWNQKQAWSCIDIMCSSKYVDFYAFPFAMRPSGSNANAQLILPGEKKNI